MLATGDDGGVWFEFDRNSPTPGDDPIMAPAGGRPPTSAAIRREIVKELRDINAIMRVAVNRWSFVAQTFEDGAWRKREPHELPENDGAELNRLLGSLRDVITRAMIIQEKVARRVLELGREAEAKEGES